MKKLIVVIMALITIFSASVFASAAEIIEAPNVYFESFADIPYFRTAVTSATANVVSDEDFQAYRTELVRYGLPVGEARVNGTSSAGKPFDVALVLTGNITVYYFDPAEGDYVQYGVFYAGRYVGNASGTYCANRYHSDDEYSVVAIAGTSNYFLTDRPAGTVGNGYLGDLQVTYDNWMNIKNILDSLSGNRFYYAYGHSINGEYRYYLTGSGYSQTYYVCNSAGQLFYYVKDDGSTTPPDDGGSTFDPTEVITAINSVYDAVNTQGSRLVNSIMQVVTSANSIGSTLNMHMNNVVDGFDNLQNSLSTLNSYFTDLSGLFPVQETITLLGSDTRVAWDSADRITNVTAAGFNGDLIVKERPGDLVDESGYEKVTINETEYSLYNDNNGYRRIKANNEYPDTGSPIPDGTLFYFPFDGTLSSSVGDMSLELGYNGSIQYSSGISGDAFFFSGNEWLVSSGYSSVVGNQLSFSFWVNFPKLPTGSVLYSVGSAGLNAAVRSDGKILYVVGDETVIGGNILSVSEWSCISLAFDGTTAYCFVNGELDATFSATFDSTSTFFLLVGEGGDLFPSGSMVDELILVDGACLWTSDFDAEKKAVFSGVVSDYFLPCTDQDITLNFYDSSGEQVTEYRWNQYTVGDSRLPDGYTELDSIASSGTQYIDTGFMPNQNSKMTLDFEPTISQNACYAGTRHTSTVRGFLINSGSSGTMQYGAMGASGNVTVGDFSLGRHTQTIQNGLFTYDGVSTSVSSSDIGTFQATYSIYLFACNQNGVNLLATCRIYSCQIYDNGTLVRDFVPCKNPSNAVGLYDLVNGQFYGNSGTGSFTAGNEVSNGSGIGQLVGVVSSTNANAYPNDGIQGDFYYEYIGAFTEYPSFSQTLSPTDVNGNAITMGRLEDDFSEIYMDISTMMWYCHDPQTQTEILLSSANQQIMNDTIYVRQNYTMLPADQITADALQNLLPVDSPVYLDMPEGAKLTITYDHYTGWFRMMYILMDKQTKLLADLDIVNETIINVENTVIDITNNNPAYNVFYITKTDGTTESVGDAAKDAAVFVGDVLSMFYRLVFDDALDNAGVIQDFEDVLTTTNTGVNVW